MHKSISIAVIALFLIASPSIMFGTSNSNLFSKAMAIEEEDRSATGIIIKSNEFKDKGTSDGDKDKTSFIKTNQVKDKGTSDGDKDKTSFIKTNQVKDKGTSDGDKDKTSFIKTNQVKDKGTSDGDKDKTSFIKTNQVKDKGTSDGDKDKTSFIKSNQVKDKGTSDGDKDKTSFIKSNQVKDDNDEDKSKTSDDVEDKSKSSDATKSSDTTDNLKNPEVQRVAGGTGVPELQCDECVEYWALAIQFLSKEQGITISEAFEQFAAYFIAALPDSLNSQETKIAVDLMDCVKERALSLIATEKSQPIVEETSLQTQKSQAQTIEGSQQKQMQQEQPFEKLQLLPLVGQSNQNNEAQQMTKQSQPVVKETSQPVVKET